MSCFRRFLFLALFLCSHTFFFLHADVSSIYLFSEARELFEKADSSTLIMLDVEGCLIHPVDLCLRAVDEADARVQEQAWQGLKTVFKELENEDILTLKKSIILKNAEMRVYETTLRKMIYKNKSEKRGGRFMAVTHKKTGRFAIIEDFEPWLCDTLKRHGYDFSVFFEGPIVSKQQLSGHNKQWMFHKGILFIDDLEYIESLDAFLEQVMTVGGTVLFFHPERAFLNKLDKKLSGKTYQFKGVHYQPYDPNPFNFRCEKDIIDYQLNFLMIHNTWLEENRVRSLLNFGF